MRARHHCEIRSAIARHRRRGDAFGVRRTDRISWVLVRISAPAFLGGNPNRSNSSARGRTVKPSLGSVLQSCTYGFAISQKQNMHHSWTSEKWMLQDLISFENTMSFYGHQKNPHNYIRKEPTSIRFHEPPNRFAPLATLRLCP